MSLLIGILFGCNAITQPTATLSPTPMMCLDFVVEADITCTLLDDSNAILQSASRDSVTIGDDDFTISFRGTVQVRRFTDRVVVNDLEGSAVVTVDERTRVLRGGQRIELQVVEGQIQPPEGGAEAINHDELTEIAIDRAPRLTTNASAEATTEATEDMAEATEQVAEATTEADAVEEQAVVEVTATATTQATQPNVRANIIVDCEPRTAWQDTYTVEAGDVLELIAEDYGTTVQEMALANCLANPSRLVIGQILRVPGALPTLTPSAIAFRADTTTLVAGDCTTIRWDVFNVEAVFFDEEQTTGTNVRRICPETTTTYTLRVVYRDDNETTREVTVTVNEP